MAGSMGHTGGLTNPRPWSRRCQAGYSNTGGPPLPRKRAPFQKNLTEVVLGDSFILSFSKIISNKVTKFSLFRPIFDISAKKSMIDPIIFECTHPRSAESQPLDIFNFYIIIGGAQWLYSEVPWDRFCPCSLV